MITCHRNLKEKRWFLAKGQGRENQETLKNQFAYGSNRWEESGH